MLTIAGRDSLREVPVGDVVAGQADAPDGRRQPRQIAHQPVAAEVQPHQAGEVGKAGREAAVQTPALAGLCTQACFLEVLSQGEWRLWWGVWRCGQGLIGWLRAMCLVRGGEHFGYRDDEGRTR